MILWKFLMDWVQLCFILYYCNGHTLTVPGALCICPMGVSFAYIAIQYILMARPTNITVKILEDCHMIVYIATSCHPGNVISICMFIMQSSHSLARSTVD